MINILLIVDDDSNENVIEVIDLDISRDDPPINRRDRSSSSSSSQDIETLPRPVTSSNKRKKTKSSNSDEDNDNKEDLSRTTIQNDAEVCPICLEEWTNSGQHRLVATECGHLFGKMFITSFFFFFY